PCATFSALFPYTTLFRSGAAVDAFDVLHGHRLHHVHFARQERRHARSVVANGGEDHLARVALDLPPVAAVAGEHGAHIGLALAQDRKSTRLNSSHVKISY